MLRVLAVTTLALAAPSMLRAQPAPGPNDFVQAGQPAGQARLRIWGLDVYDARLFFGIWLAPWTSEPALRAALLAGSER